MNKSGKNKRGRPDWAPNLRTQDLFEIAQDLDCNPFVVLIHFAKGDYEALGYEQKKIIVTKESTIEEYTISPELRAKAAEKACEYLYPKRKAVEHSISPKDLPDEELISETKRLLSEALAEK